MEKILTLVNGVYKKQSLESLFIWGIGLMLFASSVIHYNGRANSTKEPSHEVTTIIPSGFNLVPLEIQNIEKVDSLIGQMAIVHIYGASSNGKKLVGKNVRLLRSPKNPNVFAALVPISQTSYFLNSGPTYSISISSPSASGTEIVMPKKTSKQEVIYESI